MRFPTTRSILMLSGVVVLFLFAVAGGCRGRAGAEVIVAELKSDYASYAVGDTFRGSLTFTNPTSRNAIAGIPSGEPEYEVLGYDNESDSLVLRFAPEPDSGITTFGLSPGQSEVKKLGFPLVYWAVPETLLPAGSYRLRGLLNSPGGPHSDITIRINGD